VTASLGIAAYPESKAASGEDLVRRADRALYRAKKTGKNRVELFWSDESGPARLVEEITS
jgi:diguanylate cyclase (GGDEF)-like protein